MDFEEVYQGFLTDHILRRNGECRRRLQEGMGNAEKMFLKQVWWPLFHHFHHLHPEFEVNDFKDGKRYLDFAYLRAKVQICFEIDGYGPHLRNISRWQFSDSLERQNQLVIDGWTIIRFSYDQIMDQPRRCQQIIQQVIGKQLGEELEYLPLTFLEKEILRFAFRKEAPITPAEVEQLLSVSTKPAKKALAGLVQKGILRPASGSQRIRAYRIMEGVTRRVLR
jgi:very-short-patch-repair endonuclease